MLINNQVIKTIRSTFEKIKYIIKRTKTRYLVTYLWMFGFFLMGILIYFPKSQIDLLIIGIAMIFVGIGGMIMIIRKESIFSGESENIVGIIYGSLFTLLGFGLAIFFIYIYFLGKFK
jgi:hypothetical protein